MRGLRTGALGAAAVALALGAATPASAQSDSVPGEQVVLRGLDKLTGRVETLEAEVGGAVPYERLRIEVKSCNRRTEARAPDSTAFLQIFDTKGVEDGEPEQLVFSGWMFASSPALSAMDHSRYDVWVVSCDPK